MLFPPPLEALIGGLRCLPGVGQKTAQRMAFYLLQRDREGAGQLAGAIRAALEQVQHCTQCRMFSSEALCPLCASPRRNAAQLCVVESPADVVALEQGTDYEGRYFVLLGRLSPLDGIGPEELGLDRLAERIRGGEILEIILATNPTVEGEATAHYIAEIARAQDVKVSRIAHGVPVGGELEYVDGSTLSRALDGRRDY